MKRVNKDMHSELKQSFLEVLNSKATHEELRHLQADKTNKKDTDLQMRSIDIMHK